MGKKHRSVQACECASRCVGLGLRECRWKRESMTVEAVCEHVFTEDWGLWVQKGVCPVCRWVNKHLCACTWLCGEQYVPFLPLQLREDFESVANSPRSSGTGKGLGDRAPGREQ